MTWAYRQSAMGWIVFKGETWFKPNQFGAARCIGTTAFVKAEIDFEGLWKAQAAARKAYPPDHTGRYSYRGSEIRGRYCEALCAVLNALPTPSVSAE